MTGKHRRPRPSTGRNLAAAAAVLTAGALPLAAGGEAFAADAPAVSSPLSAVQVGDMSSGIEQMARPLQATLPLAGDVARDAAGSVSSGGGMLGSSPQAQANDAAVDQQAAFTSAELATKAVALTGNSRSMGTVLPVSGAITQGAQAAPADPTLLHGGEVGTLAQGFGGQAEGLTAHVDQQMQPTVAQLHTAGVPTVEDVTSTLSSTKMPMFGTVGGLTSTVPVNEMLGQGSPVLGTVGAASGL